MENVDWHRVVKTLAIGVSTGTAPKICDRCGATIFTYAGKCQVSYRSTCPGWHTVDRVSKGQP